MVVDIIMLEMCYEKINRMYKSPSFRFYYYSLNTTITIKVKVNTG